jgi:surfactin synthase thioesterase subunit
MADATKPGAENIMTVWELIGPAEAGVAVLAIPYAGGSSWAFRPWRRHLPPQVALMAADLPGHGRRREEPCLTRFDDAVADLAAGLAGVALPVVLAGYSLGGRLAFELAHHLIQAGTPPLGLVACMARGPQTGLGHPRFAASCSEADFLPQAVANGLADPRMAGCDEMRIFVGPLKSDLTMAESYEFRPRPRLRLPTWVVGADADALAPEPALRAWDEVCAGPVRHVRLPGGHLQPGEDPALMASVIAQAVDDIVGRQGKELP